MRPAAAQDDGEEDEEGEDGARAEATADAYGVELEDGDPSNLEAEPGEPEETADEGAGSAGDEKLEKLASSETQALDDQDTHVLGLIPFCALPGPVKFRKRAGCQDGPGKSEAENSGPELCFHGCCD